MKVTWLVLESIGFGVFVFLAGQGFFDLTGIAKTSPALGAITMGVLASFQYAAYKIKQRRFEKTWRVYGDRFTSE